MSAVYHNKTVVAQLYHIYHAAVDCRFGTLILFIVVKTVLINGCFSAVRGIAELIEGSFYFVFRYSYLAALLEICCVIFAEIKVSVSSYFVLGFYLVSVGRELFLVFVEVSSCTICIFESSSVKPSLSFFSIGPAL